MRREIEGRRSLFGDFSGGGIIEEFGRWQEINKDDFMLKLRDHESSREGKGNENLVNLSENVDQEREELLFFFSCFRKWEERVSIGNSPTIRCKYEKGLVVREGKGNTNFTFEVKPKPAFEKGFFSFPF